MVATFDVSAAVIQRPGVAIAERWNSLIENVRFVAHREYELNRVITTIGESETDSPAMQHCTDISQQKKGPRINF